MAEILIIDDDEQACKTFFKGNVPEACKQSGLSRSQLYRLMQQHKLNID